MDAPVKQSVKIHVANRRKSSTNQDSFTRRNIQESSIFSGNLPPLLHLHFLPSELPAHPSINQILYSLSKIINYTPFFLLPNMLFFFYTSQNARRRQTLPFAWSASTSTLRSPVDYKARSKHPISFVCSVSFSRRHFFSPPPAPRFLVTSAGRRERSSRREKVCVCVRGLGV